MSKKLVASTDLFDAIEVDLWGDNFVVRQPTRAVERKVEEAAKGLDEMDDGTTPEEVVAAMGDMLDAILEPVPNEEGKKRHAKTVVKERYAADQIGFAHIEALLDKIAQLRSERPT
jgi:hypothetical protein